MSALIRMRNRYLALAAISFLVWQGAILFIDAIAALGMPTDRLQGPLGLVELMGALGWVAATLMFLVYAGKLTRSGAQSVIEDELFRHQQAKALRFGFLALMVCLTALFVAVQFVALPAGPVLRLLMVAGVCTPLLSFVVMARDTTAPDEAV